MSSGTIRVSLALAIISCMAISSPGRAGELFSLPWSSDGSGFGFHNASSGDFESAMAAGPNAIAIDGAGNLIFADTENSSVAVIDTSGNVVRRIGSPDGDDLELVSAVAPLGDDEIVAGLARDGSIVKIDFSGTVTRFYTPTSDGDGAIGQIQTLATDSQGRIYAGDVAFNKILRISREGEFEASFPWDLTGFSVAADGTLYRLQYGGERGWKLVATSPSGADRQLFTIPALDGKEALPGVEGLNQAQSSEMGLASPRLLGQDESGNFYIRHVRPGEPGILAVRRLSPDGSDQKDLGTVPATGAEDNFTVTPDGRVLAMQFDASTAPEGQVTIVELR